MNINSMTMNKKTYEAPLLSEQSLAAEKGFAESGKGTATVNAWYEESVDDELSF